jgi:hypothetical protein
MLPRQRRAAGKPLIAAVDVRRMNRRSETCSRSTMIAQRCRRRAAFHGFGSVEAEEPYGNLKLNKPLTPRFQRCRKASLFFAMSKAHSIAPDGSSVCATPSAPGERSQPREDAAAYSARRRSNRLFKQTAFQVREPSKNSAMARSGGRQLRTGSGKKSPLDPEIRQPPIR